jgi:hypothetical protein
VGRGRSVRNYLSWLGGMGRGAFKGSRCQGHPSGCEDANLGALCGPYLRPSSAAPPLWLLLPGAVSSGGWGIDLIFKLISMDTYARAACASIMRHLCSFIARQKCLLIIGGRVGVGSGRWGAGTRTRGHAAAGSQREGRRDSAWAIWGDPTREVGPCIQAGGPSAPHTGSPAQRARRAARSRGPRVARD